MTPAVLRHLAAEARHTPGSHGTLRVTVWQAERWADLIERLEARVAELEQTEQPTLWENA